MVSSIGPFWDANETWLVLGIGILLIAFPVAHGLVLGALYLPVVAMLVGPDAARRRLRIPRQGATAGTASCGTGCSGPAPSSPRSAQGLMLGRYITGFAARLRLLHVRAARGRERCAAATCCSARPGSSYKTEGELQGKAIALGALGPRVGGARRGAGQPRHALCERHGTRRSGSIFRARSALMLLPLATLAAWFWLWRATGEIAPRPGAASLEAVRRRGGDLRARLRRPRLQPLSVRRDRPADDLGRGRAPFGAEGRSSSAR